MAARRTGWSDESFAASTMVLSVVRVAADEIDAARSALRDLLLDRSGFLHFSKESESRRTALAKAVGGLGLDLTVVIRQSRDTTARARAICLTTVAWALHETTDLLVLESRGVRPDRLDAELLGKVAVTGCRLPVTFAGKRRTRCCGRPTCWRARPSRRSPAA